MRIFETNLKVSDWTSKYDSIDKTLKHYSRRTKSQSTRENVLASLNSFFQSIHCENPDTYIKTPKSRVQKEFQAYLDDMKSKDRSIAYINMHHAYLMQFFQLNGFKNGRTLEVESFFEPARYRKKEEYIPSKEEVLSMINSATSMKGKAIIACLYSSGLRIATMVSLRYKDVKSELEKGNQIIKLPIYPEMKKWNPDACKNSIPYYSFISPEAVRLLKLYIAEMERKFDKFQDDYPLFIGQRVAGGRIAALKTNSADHLIHDAARQAGIAQWEMISAKCLRTAFQNILKSEFVEGSGRMDEKDQEFLMGHVLDGSKDNYYDSTKVEELRSQYAKLGFDKNKIELNQTKLFKQYQDVTRDLNDTNVALDLVLNEMENLEPEKHKLLLQKISERRSQQLGLPKSS